MSYSHRKEVEPDETIYNLIPKEAPTIIKPKRYKSIHAERVNNTYITNKTQSKTMGPAKVPQSDIKNFLKKGTGPKTSPTKTTSEKT
ncbi:hypothetical protein, partial [Salmonella sp. s51228]|uniref:hypothetical protein n=1 Tax=Salmonella sp. s51228 TaxID=3159652 RepID=UPI003981663F